MRGLVRALRGSVTALPVVTKASSTSLTVAVGFFCFRIASGACHVWRCHGGARVAVVFAAWHRGVRCWLVRAAKERCCVGEARNGIRRSAQIVAIAIVVIAGFDVGRADADSAGDAARCAHGVGNRQLPDAMMVAMPTARRLSMAALTGCVLSIATGFAEILAATQTHVDGSDRMGIAPSVNLFQRCDLVRAEREFNHNFPIK